MVFRSIIIELNSSRCLMSLHSFSYCTISPNHFLYLCWRVDKKFWFDNQAEKRKGYLRFQEHALNMLIAGPALWVLGSIHNSCQIYERADGHVQILQESVLVPFLMGSLLFLVGAVLNTHEQSKLTHMGTELLVIKQQPLIYRKKKTELF